MSSYFFTTFILLLSWLLFFTKLYRKLCILKGNLIYMEYEGYKKYGKFIDREVLHADQLNVLWDSIRQNGSEIDKIYKELSIIDVNKIDSSIDVLGFKGKITIKHFLELPAAKQGEIYQIEDDEANINFYNNKWDLSLKKGDFVICTKSFDSTDKINKENIKEYWKINTQTAFSNASSFESGMVSTGNQAFSGNKVFNDNVTILGKLQLSQNEIYIGGTPVVIPDNNLVLKTVELLKNARERLETLEGVDQDFLEKIEQLEKTISVVNNALAAFRDKTAASFTELTEKYNEEIANIYKMLADFDERLKNLYVKTEVDRAQLTAAYKDADEKLKQELLLDHDEINNSINLAADQVKREFNLADDIVRAEFQDADAILRHDFETADIEIKHLIKKTEDEIRADFTQADKEIINAFTSADELITNRTTEEFSKVRAEIDAADRRLSADMEAADAAIISSFYSSNAALQRKIEETDQSIRNDFRADDSVISNRVNDLHNQVNSINANLVEKVNQTVTDALDAALSGFNKDNNLGEEILRQEFLAADDNIRSEFAIADENVREEIYKSAQKTSSEIDVKTARLEANLRKDFFQANNLVKNDIESVKDTIAKINTSVAINSSKINKNINDIQSISTLVNRNTELITVNTDNIADITKKVNKVDENIAIAVTDAKIDLTERYTAALNQAKAEATEEFAKVRTEIIDTKKEVTDAYTSDINAAKQEVTEAYTKDLNQAKVEATEEFAKVRTEISATKNEVTEAYTKDLNQAKVEVTDAYTNDINTAKQEVTEAYTKDLNQAKTEVTEELVKVRTEISNTKKEVTDAYTNDITTAKQEVTAAYTNDINTAKTDITAAYTTDINTVKQEVTDAYTKKVSTLTKLVTTADTELKNQANALEERAGVIETNVENLTTENSNLTAEQTKIKEDITSNLTQIQENTRRIVELETNGPVNPNPGIPAGNAGIERMTEEEFNALPEKDPNKFYFILENNEPKYLYIGNFLIAQKGNTNQEFPYVFPIIF